MHADEDPRPVAATSTVLRGVIEAHEAFHRGAAPRQIFSSILDVIFNLTGSRSGYIGELIERPEGRSIRLMVSSHEFDVIGSIPVSESGPDLYRLMTAPVIEDRVVAFDRDTLGTSHPDVITHLPPFGRFVGLPTEGSGRVNGVVGFLDPVSEDLDPASFAVLADSCGLLIAAYQAARDRHEIAAMLERREHTLEAILATAGVGIVTVDREGRVLTANEAGAGMFGRTPVDLVGRHLEHLVDAPPTQTPIDLGDAIEHESGIRVVGRRKDGSSFPAHARAKDLELERDGSRVVVLTDLTQIEGITRDLVAAVDRAELADEAKSRFLATMSHEIRTPLNGIVGMVELLAETDLDPDQRDYTETLRGSCNALLSLVNTVLDFSRIDADRMTYADEPFDPVASVDESLSVFRAEAAKKGLWLRSIVGPGVPLTVSGDGDRVRQVVLNLIGNAVKFTRDGGITVVTEQIPGRSDGLRIRVVDTGVGISSADLPTIFERFTQVGSDAHRTVTGTGLGLAIAKQLATDMGGDLTVVSELGTGSEFCFDIIRPTAQVPPTDSGPVADVLIVHPDPAVRGALAGAVHRLGWRAFPLADGAAARTLLVEGGDFTAVVADTFSLGELGPSTSTGASRPRFVEIADSPTDLVSRALVGIDAVIDPATGPADLRRALRGRAIDVIPEVRPDTRMPPAGSVLVADDDETNRKMIRSALAGAGYDFTIVDNGADALDAARSRAFDIMLLDVRMPEIDGLELTRRIRAMGGPQPRILVMTADTASSTEAAARGNGADAVLLKPVPPSILVDTIRRTIEISPSNPPAAVPDGRMTVDLDRVIAFFEDRHLALGFLGDFRSHTGERLEELRGDPDPELVRRVAHQLRNVSSMLGADGVAALAAEIDRPDGPPDGWASGASRLRNALAVMIDSVEIHLGGGAA